MTAPVRALLVTNHDRGGGAILVARVAKNLDRRVVEPVVYVPRDGFIGEMLGGSTELLVDPDFAESPNQRKFGLARPFELITTRGLMVGRWLRAGNRLRRTLAAHRIDVLFGFGVESQVYAAAVGALAGLPVVWSAQKTFDDPSESLIVQTVAHLGAVKAIIAVSEAAGAPFAHVGRKVRVIFNGVDPAEFDPAVIRPALRERLGGDVPADATLVGVVGRPSHEKGFDVFIRAAARVARERPSVRFVMVGAGAPTPHLSAADRYAAEDRLAALIEELGLTGRVLYTGPLDDVRPLVAGLDVVALPSRRDAAPLVAFEAMALGKPIAGSDIHGIPEIVRHGIDGLLTPPEDDVGLARSITTMVDDPALRARMGAAGRVRAVAEFDIARNVGRMGALLASVARGEPVL